MNINKILPKYIQFILSIYLCGLVAFSIFRLILTLTNIEQLYLLPTKTSLLFKAFIMGLRFDTVISGYILILPLLVMLIMTFFRQGKVRGLIN